MSDPSPSAAPVPEGSRPVAVARGKRALLAAAALALAGLIVVAGWEWWQLHQREELREDALRDAKALAVQVTSYDYRDMDDYFGELDRVSTGEYADQYLDSTDELRELVTNTRSVVEAEVVAAGVSEVSDDSATVVLFVDQTVQNKALTAPRIDRNRLEMTLVRDGDGWLISSLELL